jgi:hypothetical protein
LTLTALSLLGTTACGAPGEGADEPPARGAGTGQGAGEIELIEPARAFPESYSYIQTIRELPDGRVMWADPLGQALVVADLDAERADTLGRVGQGPEEYRQPDAVWPLPGDSTLLVDLGNGRLTAIGPDGTFGETWPIGQGQPGAGMVIALPVAVDDQGRLYIQGRFGPAPGGQLPDSAPVLRFDRGTGAVDTVATVKLEERTMDRSGGPGNQRVSIGVVPLSPADAWGVALDGRIAVARSGDYHLEWLTPDGSSVAGSSVDVEEVAIGQAEKEEWDRERSLSGGGLSIGLTMTDGVAQMSFSRGGNMRLAGGDEDEDSGLDRYDWPDRKPPFYDARILVDDAGRAWVRRHVEAGERPTFDVFDDDAERVATVRLPLGRRIVGFGPNGLYVVNVDEFDLNYLERYDMPAL